MGNQRTTNRPHQVYATIKVNFLRARIIIDGAHILVSISLPYLASRRSVDFMAPAGGQ